MRVLLISGAYPPRKCGVGEYVRHLASALAKYGGLDVSVITSVADESGSRHDGRVAVNYVVKDWKVRGVVATMRAIVSDRPDVVHIQYPSREYNGALASLLPVLLKLRGIPVVQTWHEHYVECRAVAWPNLLACDALIHVRADLPSRLPKWVAARLAGTPVVLIRNASTIPTVSLQPGERESLRARLSAGRPIVAFFGFANPNKGVERLFKIADPASHHLLLICDLDAADDYQKSLLERAASPEWHGHVTVTGFLPAERVAQLLAVADAVVFPFPSGAGDWNTSLQAAEAAGVLALATTKDESILGLDEVRNTYWALPGDISGMRKALATYVGRRIPPSRVDAWESIALEHARVYRSVVSGTRA